MNIKLIDQVLNVAIASLIYGSEIWFVYAFSAYVVRRTKEIPDKTLPAPNAPANRRDTQTASGTRSITSSGHSTVATDALATDALATDTLATEALATDALATDTLMTGSITIDIVPSVAKGAIVQSSNVEPVKKLPEKIISETPMSDSNQQLLSAKTDNSKNSRKQIASKQSVLDLTSQAIAQPQAIVQTVVKTVVKTVKPVSSQSTNQTTVCDSIGCEPIDWTVWKVSDLRKASIAQACGVRIRPIGSSRNLPKADLIAQYKQNLKRLTKLPPKKTPQQSKTA